VRLRSILLAFNFVQAVLVTVALVGQILRSWRDFADGFALSAVGLIAPDLGFIAM
jgi:hypothetical protein